MVILVNMSFKNKLDYTSLNIFHSMMLFMVYHSIKMCKNILANIKCYSYTKLLASGDADKNDKIQRKKQHQ